MDRPVIVCLGVCHRDVELACLWLRWVAFLSTQPGGDMIDWADIIAFISRRVTERQESELRDCCAVRQFGFDVIRCKDEDESGYPRSASHLFLRTLEWMEVKYRKTAVLWCEADTVPMRPTWFAEISAEYDACGKPFLGARVGKKFIQMSGNAVYPADWRKLAPKIAGVLSAPDISSYGKGKGCAWDVWAADQVVPQMAVSKRIYTVWKSREIFATPLKDIPAECALFHQDKTGSTIREIAALRYPEFMATLTSGRRFFFMNGHPSRVAAKGLRIKFSYHKFSAGFHRTAVCSDELTESDASALATLVGQLGIREMTEDEFLKLTGRQAKSLPPARVRTIERAPSNHSHPQVFVMLGRYGDIINILPLLKSEADAGRRPSLVVSKDFADILDGVSYCDRIVWDGAYDQLPEALRWLRASKKIMAPVVAQVHRNPLDRARLTPSYQTEAWRLAGHLGDFATRGPLVFDQRSPERERELVGKLSKDWDDNPPVIAIALESASSPLGNNLKNAIYGALQFRFKKLRLVDVSEIKAARIYDILAVLEMASVILTCDTSILHLSRGLNREVVALANTGWRGSKSEHARETIRYEDVTAERVVAAVERAYAGGAVDTKLFDGPVSTELTNYTTKNLPTHTGSWIPEKLEPSEEIRVREVSLNQVDITVSPRVMREMFGKPPRVFHVVDVFGDDPRHQVAQSTWAAAYEDGMVAVHLHEYARDAKTELGHKKALPFLKDILQAGLNESANDDDVVCWTNSDIGFSGGSTQAIGAHVRQHGAASMRRVESNGDHHMGRDMFAFTAKWLKENWNEIPDYVIGVPVFDLGLVAMIRLKAGIKIPVTTKNLGADMPPADMPPGMILHQSHTSEWLELNHHTKAASKWNHDRFYEWTRQFAPETRFSKGHNLL